MPIGRKVSRPARAWAWALLLFLAGLAPGSAAADYRYVEIEGDRRSVFTWDLEPGNPVRITVTQGPRRFVTWCRPDGATLRWEMQDADGTHLTVERNGGRLEFRGQLGGSTLARQSAIDDAPWFQALSFSLRLMHHASPASQTFWTVRSDTLDVLKMQAQLLERAGEPAAGDSVARQVRVRVAGWQSALWHADYWFRERDDLFVRYRSVHGPPGTDATEVHLVP